MPAGGHHAVRRGAFGGLGATTGGAAVPFGQDGTVAGVAAGTNAQAFGGGVDCRVIGGGGVFAAVRVDVCQTLGGQGGHVTAGGAHGYAQCRG